ncbi:WASH complex subunit 3-like [Tubulanus polymorphus]|uniref:WASH complex subunit 3-like n=1 Tax=Tubulanus polymorphus TaxID=672921 RepID=UPI003DA5C62A
MDAHGLPIVGPGIDYTKVGAVHQKRTLAFLNHFISHTTRFLNRFSCVCEEKLEVLSNRIQRLEVTMSILETKLSSIPGLENVKANPSTSSTTTSDTNTSQQPAEEQNGPYAPE